MQSNFRHVFPIIAALIMCQASFAQGTTTQSLIWLKYFNQWRITDKVHLHTEIEERRFSMPDRAHQRLLPRVGLEYVQSDRISFNVGGVFFQQFLPHDPNIESELFHEWRPHQYVAFSEVYGKFKLQSRIMFEERFIERPGFGEVRYLFNFRERTLFKLSFQTIKGFSQSEKSALNVYVYDELFVQAGEGVTYNVFDQNRIGGGFNLRVNDYFAFDLSYLNWYQQQGSGVDFFNRHIIHLSLLHTI